MLSERNAVPERILVIEDDRSTRDLFSRWLGHEKYSVLTASDGEEGLRKALQEKPDLILLDLNLPHMSGLEVLQALRKKQSNIPVILMTVFGSEQVVVEALRLGVRDYLNKPCTTEELETSVERALVAQRWALQREQLAHQQAALQAMERLIVTVAHYVNNPLLALTLGMDTLRERLRGHPAAMEDTLISSTLDLLDRKIEEITAVVQVLQRGDALPVAAYVGRTEMFDIEKYLQERLREVRGK